MERTRGGTSALILAAGLLAVTAQGASGNEPGEVRAVEDVDLERYAGTWYEIARLPNRFQEDCLGDVTATYAMRADGKIDVLNRCARADGSWNEARGLARRATHSGPASRLEVRFAPAWLSFLPAVWGDYWVLALDSDYRWALIGDPDRRYLWVLSRSPAMEEQALQAILEPARRQGYDLSTLIRTEHGLRVEAR